MMLMFRGAILSLDTFESLSIQPVGDCMYAVRLSPGDVTVYETASRIEAEQYIADASRAIRRGISEGAAWADLSGLPAHMEIGTVFRGRA